ncbi:hypothetical protein Hanom_Chr16g01512061 [Helianthus anomalus]
MDTNTTTTHSLEIDTTNDFEFESKYFELEKQILTLIAEDENEALLAPMNANHSSFVRINKPRYILEQKIERYLCWKHNFQNTTELVPVLLKNSWRNMRHGTGVFIPCAGKENIPSMLSSSISIVFFSFQTSVFL